MKFLKYFSQFIIIYIFFLICKIIGYKKSSNLGSLVGSFLGPFFRSSTTTFERVLHRTLSPIIFLNIGIEVGWKFAIFAKAKTTCDIQDVTVGFISFYCVTISAFNRLMQGSAGSVSESLIFEVAGTVSELVTAGEHE